MKYNAVAKKDNVSMSYQAIPDPSPSPHIIARITSIKHTTILVAGTLWWYIYSAYVIWTATEGHRLAEIISPTARRMMASYCIVSQLLAYYWLWNLMQHADTLRRGQIYVALTVSSCIPADCIIVLYDPTGNKLLTVLAFAFTTAFFCFPLAHHLREASFREMAPPLATEDGGHHHREAHYNSLGKALQAYRPTREYQSTHMAAIITKVFVSFVVCLAAVFGALGLGNAEESDEEHRGGHDGVPKYYDLFLYASLGCVLCHTAMDVFFHFLFPGFEESEFTGLVVLQTVLWFVHMIAAGLIGHENLLGPTIWDELVNTWLFGVGTVGFLNCIAELAHGVDFDAYLGLRS
ncbi:hypothetical protein ACHAXT_009037 [Thalassiosira profunda]